MFRIKHMLKHKNFPVFLTPLLLSLAIWWSMDFFNMRAYYNLGDTGFPFFPDKMLRHVYSAWVAQGLGRPNLFSAFSPVYFLVVLVRASGIPLWIINRLWLIIPTAMVGWSTYYLFASLVQGKFLRTAGLIAALFAMLPPMYEVIPVWYLALAGFPLVLGATIRARESSAAGWNYPCIIAGGFALLTLHPRLFYLTCFCLVLYFINAAILEKKVFRKETFFFIVRTILAFIMINAYWIIPLGYYSVMKNSALAENLASASYGHSVHREMLVVYKDWSHPLWIIRRMIYGHFAGFEYSKLPIIAQISFLMPVYVFAGLLSPVLRNNKKILNIAGVTVVFLFCAMALHYTLGFRIYLFLWEHLPGFVILNNPSFWLSIMGILYAVMTGATTYVLLTMFDQNRMIPRATAKRLNILLIRWLCVLICVVYGGALLIGISPQKNTWGRHIYLNHAPYAPIPEDYFKVQRYLQQNAGTGERLLNLPWTFGGYAAYSWWHAFTMPEIMSDFSPVPVLATSSALSAPETQVISLLRQSDVRVFDLLADLGVGYVLVHKDYYPIRDVFGFDHPSIFFNFFRDKQYTELVIDNQYFSLYKLNRSPVPELYPASMPDQAGKAVRSDEPLVFTKFSDAAYQISSLEQESFRLVLNQKFHPLWHCYVDGKLIEKHARTELGMNYWDIDAGSKRTIRVVFAPQKWVDAGMIVTCITLVWGFIVMLWKGYNVFRRKQAQK